MIAKALRTNRVLARRALRLELIGWIWAVAVVILVPFPQVFEQVFYLEQDYKEPPTFCQEYCQKIENMFDFGCFLEYSFDKAQKLRHRKGRNGRQQA
jgi:hypothetical protein